MHQFGLSPFNRSLYRLRARTSGSSPPDNGAKTNLAIPFDTSPSCRFSRLQGLAIIQSPLSTSKLVTRFPLVLSPFRVLHLECVGSCYQPPPLLSFVPVPCGAGRDFSGLSHCSTCVCGHLAMVPNLYPPGCCGPSGSSPVPELFAASSDSPAPFKRLAGFALSHGRHLHSYLAITPLHQLTLKKCQIHPKMA